MKPRLDPRPTVFTLIVVLATIIHFPAIRSQEPQPYDVCREPVRCGDFELEYPFWGLGRPQYCGHPSFQLTCQSNVPVLVLDSTNYRVLNTDVSTHTVNISRNDLWSTLCPDSLQNTTYNTTLFSGNNFNQEDVSLYYRCPPWTLSVPVATNFRFTCNNGTDQSDNYFYRTSMVVTEIANFLVQCETHITVPVDGSSANVLSEDDLRSALRGGFKLEWRANNDECDRCLQNNSVCGSNSTSSGLFACYQRIRETRSKRTTWKLIIGISCSLAGIMLLLLVILCQKPRFCVTLKEHEAANAQIEIFIRNHGTLAPRRYKYSEIKKMTNAFQDKLGQGGYGSVYKGQLPEGHLVAVKLLSEVADNGEDFINEVASISRTSHVNVVTLLGFCFDGKKRALLYEFMPNGSLDKFLHSEGSHLNWNTLFQIAKGIARGLEYLHRGCNTRIVHFDIKPHNILLDKEFVPKISDFGLAKLCKTKESIVSVMGARGTAGYMAPEVFIKSLGGPSHKSDVYSYGMMILEMTGARKNSNYNKTNTTSSEAYFPDWIYKQLEVGGNLGDDGVTTEHEELTKKMTLVSLWCIQSNPSDRPSISKVVEMLEGSIELLQVPPRRFESSPIRPFKGNPPSSTQSSSNEIVSVMQEKISQHNICEAS